MRMTFTRVDELAVGLVADDEQVMLLGDVDHQAHLLGREHRTGGVAGVGAHDGAGVLVDERLDARAVGVAVALLGAGRDGADLRAAGIDHRIVVGVERLGDQDLVVVVEDAVHRDLQCLGASVGDEDIALVKVHVELGIVALDGVDQLGDAGRGCVLQHGQVEVLDRVEERLGRLDIGLADVQMIDFSSLCLSRHRIGMELAHG